jgi:hypothetical protein
MIFSLRLKGLSEGCATQSILMRAMAPVTQDGVSRASVPTILRLPISGQALARKERASKFIPRAFAGLVAGE